MAGTSPTDGYTKTPVDEHSTNKLKTVFLRWLDERLALGESPMSLLRQIGADSFIEEKTSEEKMTLQLNTFATKCGGKACELIRQKAVQCKEEPGIPFALWLQERWENNATAQQVLDLLRLPKSADSVKSDAELWKGLWQASKEEAAWKILSDMAPRAPLFEAAPRNGSILEVGSIEEVASLIDRSSSILVLTGAGISVSCGLPTYRMNEGKNDFRETIAKEFGLSRPEDVSDIRTFRENPLPFFKHVRDIIPNSRTPRTPSLTHRFIRALESRGKLLRQYTQNIDCLEIAAGISRVTFCHGSFATATCVKCNFHTADGGPTNDVIADGQVPYCAKCGQGVMKPDVVLFNEPLPEGVREGIEQHTDEADLLLVIGTSLNVTPVSLIPSFVGASGDVPRILMNPEFAGRNSDFEHFLQGPSDATVQRLLDLLGWSLGDEQKCVDSC